MIYLREYTDAFSETWDLECQTMLQSTFLHERKYLSYHGNKFIDESVVVYSKGKIVGLFPAARSNDDPSLVVSHPGITFGGLLHSGKLIGANSITSFKLLLEYYKKKGYTKLLYKVPPTIYHQRPSQDDIYALQVLGGRVVRRDLSVAIDLSQTPKLSIRRKRSLRKAISFNIETKLISLDLQPFWALLAENLRQRYKVNPVHNYNEMHHLLSIYPENILLATAHKQHELIAGVIAYKSSNVVHAQYIASNKTGKQTCALDLIFNELIQDASKERYRWFDFGTCNEKQGQYLNSELYTFKAEFGGSGIVHEYIEVQL